VFQARDQAHSIVPHAKADGCTRHDRVHVQYIDQSFQTLEHPEGKGW
jgi:hypothetical protein